MSPRRISPRLPVPALKASAAVVDVVKTKHGWIAYALTGKGLLATRVARKSKSEALRDLQQERRLRGMVTEKAPGKIAWPWHRFLKEMMEGGRSDPSGVPVDERGWTPFQRRVYRHVRRIPRGRVKTYGEVARAVSSPGAARAIGQIMAHNPIAPIVPCHRVIGRDGSMTGFSSPGGVALKKRMLKREGAI